jgi:aminoglycoside phosphotransferase (APT) family kinase protein/NAD(P)-dependent dehydrogenase (short-subunit alcohol dehydrogenase family)
MNDSIDFVGTTAIGEAHRFDETRLAEWMSNNVADFKGPLLVEQFKGGQSNPTYKLSTAEKCYVLRRKPPGQLLKGAHAVEREVQVLQALATAGYPVPHVFGLCLDEQVIGTWFYVMDMVEGRIFWDVTFPTVSRDDRPRYFYAMNDTIARLHNIDYQAVGLSNYGRIGGYLERQIARWSKQYQAEAEQAGSDAHMDRLVEWLMRHIPPGDETSIVHGDFRVDNVIFHPSEPRILAVLDWELSTLGYPVADFAYHLMMYRMPPRIVAGLGAANLSTLNIPSEAAYIATYCRRTGRTEIPHIDFYVAFNMFRLTAICLGIKARIIRGTASSPRAQQYDKLGGMAHRTRVVASRAAPSMTFRADLTGQHAFVTGASSGLGRHFAKLLAGCGAHVTAAARRTDALDRLVQEIAKTGGRASRVTLDVSDCRSVRQAIAESTRITGPIDILVNNAGITSEGPVLGQTEEQWDSVIDTNLKGSFLVATEVARALRTLKRGGNVINIASILGLRQSSSVAPYAVSKAGLIQLTKILALELARFSIRVNAIAPGYFDTELNHAYWSTNAGLALIKRIPQRRLGVPTDLDGPLLLLASDASRYMNGATITVDGGHLVNVP